MKIGSSYLEKLRGKGNLQALAKEKRKERKKRDTGNIFSVSFIFRETIRRSNKI